MKSIEFCGTMYHAPYADLLPPLTEEERAQLKADIESRGVIIPIAKDEHSNIIDGFHRLSIAAELGLKPTDVLFELHPDLSEDEKRALAYDLNLHRRHLTKEQFEALKLRRDGKTYQVIGDELGISNAQAKRLVDSVITENVITEMPTTIIGKDGKAYPAKKKHSSKPRRKKSIIAKSQKEDAKLTLLLGQVDASVLPDKPLDFNRAARVLRENQPKDKPDTSPIEAPFTVDLRLGDFRQVLVDLPENSVDLIFTDPPYAKEFLPLWSDLAALAARVLKPGRLLISYTGQYHLLDVMNRLGEHLDYVWLGAIKTHGQKNICHQRKMYGKCKPLLFFSKGDYDPLDFVDDFFEDDKPEKEQHEWQQGIAPALYYIAHLTPMGGMVVDPFLGSGTTGEASVKLMRAFIGAETEEDTYATAKDRIAKALK